MTPRTTRREAVPAPKTGSRTVWTPSPVIVQLSPGREPALVEMPMTAASDLFWGDIRNQFLLICESHAQLRLRGSFVLRCQTSLPKRAIPSQILTAILAGLEAESTSLMQAAVVRVDQAKSWQGQSDFGNYAFSLSYVPNLSDVPLDKSLAPVLEPCDTGKKLQSAGQWQVADIRELLTQIVAQLPSAPSEKLKAIGELYSELQRQIAPQLAPAIAEILKGTHEMSYDEKAALAHEINAVLADSRLAIRDPKSKLPATLLAQRPKVTGPTSYLRISDTRKASDGKRHYFKVEDLSNPGVELELIDERDRPIETQRG